jgi:copper chaperone CopZ
VSGESRNAANAKGPTMRNLQLTDVNATGGGCACCSPAAAPAATADTRAGAAEVTTTIGVRGMTCGHCIGAVTSALTGLEGAHAVDVELVAGGVSTVTVASGGPLAVSEVAAAITEAGYEPTDLPA